MRVCMRLCVLVGIKGGGSTERRGAGKTPSWLVDKQTFEK